MKSININSTKLLKKTVDIALLIGVPLILIILWEILVKIGFLNKAIIPAPSKIINTFDSMVENGRWWKNISISIYRVLFGYICGCLAGVVFGFLTGMFAKVNKALAVIFGIIRSIPIIGLVPLFILWFGIGEESKIIIIAIGTFWSVLLNTQHGIENTDFKYLEVAAILEKNKYVVLTKIVVPAAIPSIFTGLRLGISAAWKSVVAAEMLAATKGIGYMISYAREMSQPAVMFVGLISVGVIGFIIDYLILKLQQKLITWG